MKKLLIGLAAVVVLLVVAVIAIPFLVPLEAFKEDITAGVEDATGRKLEIAGKMSLSLYPSVTIEVGGVRFANARGGTAKHILSLDKLEVEVQLMPLLGGELAVERLILIRPVIALELDKAGRPNWVFGTGEAEKESKDKAEDAQDDGDEIGIARLGDIRLVDGKLSYRDHASGEVLSFENINMTIALPDLDSPLDAKGDLVWRGEKISLAANIAKPRALFEDGTSAVSAEIKAAPVALGFKGNVRGGKAYRVNGAIDLSVPSIRKAAAWAAAPIEGGGKGLERLSIKGELAMQPDMISFRKAAIELDNTKAKGELRVALAGTRPALKGKLDIDRIDLNLYTDDGPAAPDAAPTAGADQGWSTEPIDLSGLKAVDADFTLGVGKIIAKKIKVGPASLTLTLKAGHLVADLERMALYGGKGQLRLEIDDRGKVPKIKKTLVLEGVQAKPFLKDAIGFDRPSGKANARFILSTGGPHEKAMVGRLNGTGGIRFADGAIEGINLGAMVRNVKTAFLDSGAGRTEKTDFTALVGKYIIRNGIVTNDGATRMISPLLRLSAAGTVDLPARTIDYRVVPKLVGSATGQGGKRDVAGLSVPVIVKGPWANISYRPDLAGIVKELVKDPAAAVESLKNLAPKEVVPDLLKKILPGGATGNPLKRLFGR